MAGEKEITMLSISKREELITYSSWRLECLLSSTPALSHKTNNILRKKVLTFNVRQPEKQTVAL
jgi:hypothetical protein